MQQQLLAFWSQYTSSLMTLCSTEAYLCSCHYENSWLIVQSFENSCRMPLETNVTTKPVDAPCWKDQVQSFLSRGQSCRTNKPGFRIALHLISGAWKINVKTVPCMIFVWDVFGVLCFLCQPWMKGLAASHCFACFVLLLPLLLAMEYIEYM